MRPRRFPVQPCANIAPSTCTLVDLEVFANEFALDPAHANIKGKTRLRTVQALMAFLNNKRETAQRPRIDNSAVRSSITYGTHSESTV